MHIDNQIEVWAGLSLKREHRKLRTSRSSLGVRRSDLHEATPPTSQTRFTTKASMHATAVVKQVSLVSRGVGIYKSLGVLGDEEVPVRIISPFPRVEQFVRVPG